MIKIAEYLSPQPTLLWKLVKQVGVDYAVGALPYGETTHEQPWEFSRSSASSSATSKQGLPWR